jgi:mannose-6-phosphate isomerase-like protein (cupin superfamily)
MIERILHDGLELACILRRSFERDGIEFFTSSDETQQLGYMKRPDGYVIKPHVHKPVQRAIAFTKEVLFIKSGRVRVDFYGDDKSYLESRILEQGDVVLLSLGGHGFEMLEESEIIEVKQGPYAGEDDKLRFDGINGSVARVI